MVRKKAAEVRVISNYTARARDLLEDIQEQIVEPIEEGYSIDDDTLRTLGEEMGDVLGFLEGVQDEPIEIPDALSRSVDNLIEELSEIVDEFSQAKLIMRHFLSEVEKGLDKWS